MEKIEDKGKSSFLDIAVLVGAIVYFVTPLDLIPDAVPIGFIDDTALLSRAFKSAKNLFSSSDIARANAKAAQLLGDNFDPEKAAKMAEMIINGKKK